MTKPPVMNRPSEPMDATRYEILRHAEDLFGHYGFKKTSMADIADRAKMSPGNLYRYFRNKQAIGLAVVKLHFQQTEAAIEAMLMNAEDPETKIRMLLVTGCRLIVGEMARNPKIMELVEWLIEEDEAWAALKEHIDWKRAKMEEQLKAGIDAGIFADRPVYETAVNIMHATKAFQTPHGLNGWRQKDTILPELEGVLNLVFSGVRAAGEPEKAS